MRSIVTVAVLAFLPTTPVHAGEGRWARGLREDPLEYRVGYVWTVALSSNIQAVVDTLGEGAVAALVDSLESDDERLAQGAVWVLCHLSDQAAARVCSGYDTPPTGSSQPKPYFPHDAFTDGVEGTVEVRFLVSSSGDVVHAVVDKSVKALDQAALQCVRRWKFEPARRKGKAVPCVALAPVTFRITRSK